MNVLILLEQPELAQTIAVAAQELGYQPSMVADRDEAIRAYQAQRHELVVTDWDAQLPAASKTFCQSIRQIDVAHCTVIVLVAFQSHSSLDLQSALDAGADDFLATADPNLLKMRLRITAQRAKNRYSSWLIEQQLRESNLRFELAVRGTQEGLWDAQTCGKRWGEAMKNWFSPRFKELLGYTDEEFPSEFASWASRLHPDDRDRIYKAVEEYIEHHQPYDVEYRLLTKSGEYRWFNSRAQGIWDGQGHLIRLAGSLRDITNIKDYEAKLQTREATWRSLVENAPDIILQVDFDGTIQFINRFTDTASNSIGRTVYEYLEEPYKEVMREGLQAVRNTGKPQRFEVKGLNENGEPGIWYANRLGPIRTDDHIESVIVIATDITARKIAEERLHSEQQGLRRLLDIQERERRLVAYDIHDGLVQYLTGALMHLEVVAANAPIDGRAQIDYARGLELLREALAEGRRLISGLRPPILDERGVVDALEYMVNEMRTNIPQIEFVNRTHFGRLAPAIEVAVFRIAQEALTNARLHSGAKRAQVELSQHGEWVRLVIRDWGRGFDPATVQEERFGLQGIQQRTRLWGASAQIDSAPGKGTTITVDFPLILENSVPPREPVPSAR